MILITFYNYSIHGIYKPSNITGFPHVVEVAKKARFSYALCSYRMEMQMKLWREALCAQCNRVASCSQNQRLGHVNVCFFLTPGSTYSSMCKNITYQLRQCTILNIYFNIFHLWQDHRVCCQNWIPKLQSWWVCSCSTAIVVPCWSPMVGLRSSRWQMIDQMQ